MEEQNRIGRDCWLEVAVICVVLALVAGCDRRQEDDTAQEFPPMSEVEGGCELKASSFPGSLTWMKDALGSPFELAELPKGIGGCQVEPAQDIELHACAADSESLDTWMDSGAGALIVSNAQGVQAVVSTVPEVSATFREGLSCCNRAAVGSEIPGGMSGDLYRCKSIDIAIADSDSGDPRSSRRVVVVKNPEFSLGDAIQQQLGDYARADGLRYKVKGHLSSKRIGLLDETTRDAPAGHVFVSIYYELRNGRPQHVTLNHRRIAVVSGDGTLIPPIAEARAVRTRSDEGEINGEHMYFPASRSQDLKDVFLMSEEEYASGFTIRFYGVDGGQVDRVVLGKRHWIGRADTDHQKENVASEAPEKTQGADAGEGSGDVSGSSK